MYWRLGTTSLGLVVAVASGGWGWGGALRASICSFLGTAHTALWTRFIFLPADLSPPCYALFWRSLANQLPWAAWTAVGRPWALAVGHSRVKVGAFEVPSFRVVCFGRAINGLRLTPAAIRTDVLLAPRAFSPATQHGRRRGERAAEAASGVLGEAVSSVALVSLPSWSRERVSCCLAPRSLLLPPLPPPSARRRSLHSRKPPLGKGVEPETAHSRRGPRVPDRAVLPGAEGAAGLRGC